MSRARRGRPRQPQKRRDSPRLTAWRRSARCKAVALRALEIADSVRAVMPRCGAKRKRDGQPCQQPRLENGRCKFHGGLTPKGADWHKIRMPAKGEVRGVEKFEAKLIAKEQRDAKKRQRLAAMTPEQRQRHEHWHQTHPPGPKSLRAAARARKGQADWFHGVVSKIDRDRAAEELRQLAIETDNFRNYREGVFG